MGRNRMEAFSDGVLAIIITIMVLDLDVPRGASFADLETDVPVFLGYVLSFIYVGIYWTNHHHLIMMVDAVNGQILWSNLHLLFWLSLIPASTSWTNEHPLTAAPACVYGIILLMCSVAYILLQNLIIHLQGKESPLGKTLGKDYKGKISVVGYAIAAGAAFIQPIASYVIYVLVALLWIIPDIRIEKAIYSDDE
ncbi:TMEM175 family protein [Bifidobacterium aquikefiricola]|uniref:TMEM175 family protein n=1 Tax=Bifidobacterium aquikefiricola TaxID=3059038 RepID=A0AB39U707_9BIFI